MTISTERTRSTPEVHRKVPPRTPSLFVIPERRIKQLTRVRRPKRCISCRVKGCLRECRHLIFHLRRMTCQKSALIYICLFPPKPNTHSGMQPVVFNIGSSTGTTERVRRDDYNYSERLITQEWLGTQRTKKGTRASISKTGKYLITTFFNLF